MSSTPDWLPSDRDALKDLIDEALDTLIGFEWDPTDLDDASEAVITALESTGLVPTLAVNDPGAS